MNILYLINFAGKAGTEKYVESLISEYHKKYAKCFFAHNIHGPLAEKMTEMQIPSVRLKMKHPFDLSAARRLAAYCRENKIDVICSQYPRENAIALLSKLFYRTPRVVFTSHLVTEYNIIWRIINRILTPYNHKIITVCSYGKRLLAKNGFPEEKTVVIHNAVKLPTEDTPSASLREELGLTDEFIIFTMSRYDRIKGLPFLLEAAAELKKLTDKPFKLIIAGDGVEKPLVSEKIKELELTDEVIELGFRTDTARLLSAADIYVNSSMLEALSFAILEALAAGLPVVATAVGGNTDMVNEENDLGFAVEYGDKKAFAEAMYTLMSDKETYERMSRNAKKTVEEKFGYENMLKRTLEEYGK